MFHDLHSCVVICEDVVSKMKSPKINYIVIYRNIITLHKNYIYGGRGFYLNLVGVLIR